MTSCQEWRIADINHDNTSGTVDLFPKYVLENNRRAFVSNDQIGTDTCAVYSYSLLRKWLNNDFYNGFADSIKASIKIQEIISSPIGLLSETLHDKVKCPSVTEVGIEYGSYTSVEGKVYPIFGSIQNGGNGNLLSAYNTVSGNDAAYWTRSTFSHYKNSDISVIAGKTGCIGSGSLYNGYYGFIEDSNKFYTIAVIRF